ncbi:hypothetical protein FD723_07470 [Nostoc sp. C052]|uniref:hypothetical protein n=1 Tax=Nostoc sp. C052 TaxID=2576902 RepID=UPI0015C3DFD8|nr:hypothetical protein [Nostoc sp. C052]QLE40309.1 hypothetical protein FD723_07470 [Nostoc sp. C052]
MVAPLTASDHLTSLTRHTHSKRLHDLGRSRSSHCLSAIGVKNGIRRGAASRRVLPLQSLVLRKSYVV